MAKVVYIEKTFFTAKRADGEVRCNMAQEFKTKTEALAFLERTALEGVYYVASDARRYDRGCKLVKSAIKQISIPDGEKQP